ncbi:MAG: hypothetical protein K2X47_12990, partial [Bdellovibrionales bacterium]|nr:hypothetical protein [Bdellovibrionales bacterium]
MKSFRSYPFELQLRFAFGALAQLAFRLVTAFGFIAGLCFSKNAFAQSSSFTYEGRLFSSSG